MTTYFQPLTIGEQTYSLSHLEPVTFSFFSKAANRELKVHVTYSNHCFTSSWEASRRPEGQPILRDSGGRGRTFCEIRYRLSLGLPEVISRLNSAQCKVWQTHARRNWAYSVRVEDPAGPYHVFLGVSRAARERVQDIDVMVESAYHETEGAPKLLGRMGFWMLCANTYLRKPISTKR